MIEVQAFHSELINNEVNFFAGVPDSLLKDICAYITVNNSANNHIITANEGSAVALGVGYYLATGKVPLVYMQNSGLGNAVNPLMSICDKEVYSIPMILFIGWRGEPTVKDEPQHIKQGRITPSMLDSMEIPYFILHAESDYKEILRNSVQLANKNSAPVAILVRKGTFSEYKIPSTQDTLSLSREYALECVLKHIPKNAVIVSTTGMLSRELFELREKYNESHSSDFLTVGSMGHTSQIALGIALANPNKQVFCFDGDGSALMHLGNYGIIGSIAPKNLKIIIFNNAAHDSVGGQPTIGNFLDFEKFAHSVQIKTFGAISTPEEINSSIPLLVNSENTALIEILIKKGARKDLGRPTSTPKENKFQLMNFINE